jgi:hypothetical protein
MTLQPITRKRILLCAFAILSAGAIWASVRLFYAAFQQPSTTQRPLAAFVPQGSLLSIESPDFAALLKSWSSSPEQRTWLTSDNYAAFSRSRLFGRLHDAQDEFATSAGLPPDFDFLQQIAGNQSLFAWYDIGKLQFLYITRMPAGDAEKTPLLQLRSKFQLRKAGVDSFYLRTQGDPERTVAFAVHGDYLLLATRQDLLANALLLMQHPGQASLQTEPYYTTSIAAAQTTFASSQPNLRMTLNLVRILPTPYFRSYWIQQNITELKQYSAAVSDLYLTAKSFREERALIPVTPDTTIATSDLAPLLQYIPASSGVYRAIAHPTTAQVIDALNDKLLTRASANFRDPHIAPVADLSAPNAGSSTDLETRIDTLPILQQPLLVALEPLRSLLDTKPLDAILTYSSAASSTTTATDNLFLPIHAAVILSSPTPFDPASLQSALTEILRAHLTVSAASLTWQSHQQDNTTYFQLDGLQHLAFATQGKLCILASDPETLLQSLTRPHNATPTPLLATTIAGFNHTAERPNLIRIASLLDRTANVQPGDDNLPFFSRNITSLSNTFQSLDSETFIETIDSKPNDPNHTVHQNVLYQWRP